MRLRIVAVGKLKDAEERGICERYLKRLTVTGKAVGLGPLEITELIESRAETAAARKADEAQRLLKSAGSTTPCIALDETGDDMSSEAFAKLLEKHAAAGAKNCTFLIGGPDGHGSDATGSASHVLSLGRMTLPHGLARALLIEQLYRAATILAAHPYHRS